jgi:hypothetical protein
VKASEAYLAHQCHGLADLSQAQVIMQTAKLERERVNDFECELAHTMPVKYFADNSDQPR